MSTLKHLSGLSVALLAVLLSSCAGEGQVCLLGYSTRPNYDSNIRTVAVPIFKNVSVRDSSREGLEYELTRAVIREIEMRTPFKVVAPDQPADTVLLGTITGYNKLLLNRNQLNEVREAEMNLTVEIVWQDLRTMEILSQPRIKKELLPPPPDSPPPGPPPLPPPVLVQSVANFIPELGQSMASARQKNCERLAAQVVAMMEKPW